MSMFFERLQLHFCREKREVGFFWKVDDEKKKKKEFLIPTKVGFQVHIEIFISLAVFRTLLLSKKFSKFPFYQLIGVN